MFICFMTNKTPSGPKSTKLESDGMAKMLFFLLQMG